MHNDGSLFINDLGQPDVRSALATLEVSSDPLACQRAVATLRAFVERVTICFGCLQHAWECALEPCAYAIARATEPPQLARYAIRFNDPEYGSPYYPPTTWIGAATSPEAARPAFLAGSWTPPDGASAPPYEKLQIHSIAPAPTASPVFSVDADLLTSLRRARDRMLPARNDHEHYRRVDAFVEEVASILDASAPTNNSRPSQEPPRITDAPLFNTVKPPR